MGTGRPRADGPGGGEAGHPGATRPSPPVRISVIGAGRASEVEEALARQVGKALARRGAVLVCGGLGGVMAAAARGCREEGGRTVGVLPGDVPEAANPWIELPLATGMGEARNALVVRFGEAVVAVGGEWGTLSEIALARKLGRAVVTLGTPPARGLGLPAAGDPGEAVDWAVERALGRRAGRGAAPGAV